MSEVETTHAAATGDHEDGHGHEAPAEPPGPVDLEAWGYAIGGGLIGLIVVVALFVASGS